MASPTALTTNNNSHRSHHALLDEEVDADEKENEPVHHELSVDTAPAELLWHVHHLRNRLERRNVVLDAVRKAYHSDIVVVREHLYQTFGKDSLPASLPSLDLRPALKLFAPKEYELRLRPCFACGGHLEIVHRDSERIDRLRRACQEFQEVEQHLRLQLVETESRAYLDRLELEKLKSRINEDRNIFIDKVNKLKKWIVGYDNARRECREMRETVARLELQNEDYRVSLAILEETRDELSRTREALENNKSLLDQSREKVRELRVAKNFYRSSEDEWKSKCHTLSPAAWLLEGDLDSSQKRGERLSSDLFESRSRLESTKGQLGEALGRIRYLDATLKATSKDHSRDKSSMLEVQKELHSRVERQERELHDKAGIIGAFISGVGDSTRLLHDIHASGRKHSVGHDAPSRDKMVGAEALVDEGQPHSLASDVANKALRELNAEISSLRSKVNSLTSFTSGYAACIFDQCTSQEELLRSVGHALEGSAHQSETASTDGNEKPAAAIIMNLLNNFHGSGVDNGDIDWATVLDHEDDRRQILAQLGNRMQMGLYSMEKAIENRKRKHDDEMKKISSAHDRRLGNIKGSHEQEMVKLHAELDKMNSKYDQSDIGRKRLECDVGDLSSKLDSAHHNIHELEGQLTRAEGQVTSLEERLAQSQEQNQAQRGKIDKQNDTIARQRADLEQKDKEIHNRNLIIDQLEQLLQKTTQNYAAVMGKERIRLETSQSVAIQAEPGTACAGVSVDLFIPPRLRSRPLRKDSETGECVLSRIEIERVPLPHHTEHIS